jgi:CHAT domain-containing protein
MVSAQEILREWKLDADLVILSACDTGLGAKVAGEGYVGLAHALFQVGARSVVVSMWKVEDAATGLLMVRFHENLSGARGERMSRV